MDDPRLSDVGIRRYPCSGCGRWVEPRAVDAEERTWDDLPWAAHPVTLGVCSNAGSTKSPLWNSDRAERVRRSEGARDAALPRTDRPGLSVDADE